MSNVPDSPNPLSLIAVLSSRIAALEEKLSEKK